LVLRLATRRSAVRRGTVWQSRYAWRLEGLCQQQEVCNAWPESS